MHLVCFSSAIDLVIALACYGSWRHSTLDPVFYRCHSSDRPSVAYLTMCPIDHPAALDA
jgi:hypothetical protein